MSEANIDFPIYDVDNHMYETVDAFTKFLPREYAALIKYVEVKGRTKIAIKNVVSDYIPNPTFEVVARPGAQQDYFKHGNPEGKSRREILGEPMRSIDAYFAPEPRLALMDELGIDRAIMWPTLASLLEERLSDDPKRDARGHPRVQSVDVRAVDVQLRGPHLPDAGDHVADRGARDRGAGVGREPRCAHRADPARTGARLRRNAFVRAARVRSVLAEGGGGRHRRRHALLRRRHDEVHQRLGGKERRVPSLRSAVRVRGRVPLPAPRDHGRDALGGVSRALHAVPVAARAAGRERFDVGRAAPRTAHAHVRHEPAPVRGGAGRRVQAQRVGAPVPRGRPDGHRPAHRRRSRALRLRLPAPGGSRAAAELHRAAAETCRTTRSRASWAATSPRS